MRSAFPIATPSRLSRAVLLACLSLGAAAAAPLARAQAASPSAPVRHDIPGGPLDQVLNRFAVAAGITLTIDGQLTAGRTSPGLSGEHDVRGGLAAILAGTGLAAAPQAGGAWAIVKTPSDESALPVVKVRAAAELDDTTEGSGSYTTGRTTAAVGLPLSLRETPQSVTVITRQRLDDQNITQLATAVEQVTGLTMTQSGNGGSDSSIIYSRGFAVQNYLIDGIGQNYSNYSGIFQTQDLAPYDRVEVVRGASGLLNGLGAPGATLNLVRKKPTAAFQASGRVEAGSWNFLRADLDVSGAVNEAGTLRARAVAAVQDNDSWIDRYHERRKIFYGIAEADLTSNTLATAGVSVQHHDAGAHARGGRPAFDSNGARVIWARSDSAAANWAYSERHNTSLFGSLEHRFDSGWTAQATVSRNRSDYDERLGYAGGGALQAGTGQGVSIWASGWEGAPVQDNIDLRANGPFEAFGRRHDLFVGLSSSRTSDSTPDFAGWSNLAVPDIFNWDGDTPAAPVWGPRGTFGFTERLTSAVAAARLKPLDPLSVIVGARVTDWRNTLSYADADGALTSYEEREETGQVTPFVGVVYDVSKDWSVYASYTNIFKPQNNQDLNGNFLQPQLGNTFEVGAKAALFENRLNLSGAVYRIAQDNFAVAIPGGFVNGDPSKQAYRAEQGTLSRGFEVEASGALTTAWQLSAGFTRNLAQNRDGGPLDTTVPANTFKLFTTYRIAGIGEGLTVGGGVRWQSDVYTDNTVDVGGVDTPVRFEQKAYSVVDLMARWQATRQVAVSVNLNNTFDTSYYTATWNSYYGAPRNVRVAVDAKF